MLRQGQRSSCERRRRRIRREYSSQQTCVKLDKSIGRKHLKHSQDDLRQFLSSARIVNRKVKEIQVLVVFSSLRFYCESNISLYDLSVDILRRPTYAVGSRCSRCSWTIMLDEATSAELQTSQLPTAGSRLRSFQNVQPRFRLSKAPIMRAMD